MKCSRKWGPVDPIMRYNWVQWHSKAKEGERDFTLKRRGTRDYAHSVKKRSKLSKSYNPALSDITVATISGTYKNDQNQNTIRMSDSSSSYIEPAYNYVANVKTFSNPPMKVTALVDTLDQPVKGGYNNNLEARANGGYNINLEKATGGYKMNLNPLAQQNNVYENANDGSASEGYGTFRKGPFVINDDGVNHVCYRRYSEEATEL